MMMMMGFSRWCVAIAVALLLLLWAAGFCAGQGKMILELPEETSPAGGDAMELQSTGGGGGSSKHITLTNLSEAVDGLQTAIEVTGKAAFGEDAVLGESWFAGSSYSGDFNSVVMTQILDESYSGDDHRNVLAVSPVVRPTGTGGSKDYGGIVMWMEYDTGAAETVDELEGIVATVRNVSGRNVGQSSEGGVKLIKSNWILGGAGATVKRVYHFMANPVSGLSGFSTAGTVTEWAGMWIEDFPSYSGGNTSVTDGYGVYIGDLANVSGNQWSIYSEGTGDQAYFAGDVEVDGTFESLRTLKGDAATGHNASFTLSEEEAKGAVLFCDMGAAGVATLPAGQAGMSVTFWNADASNDVEIDPPSGVAIVREGTTQSTGVSVTLSAGIGNFVTLVYDGTSWVTLGFVGTLAQGS